jgi:SH3 domain protein
MKRIAIALCCLWLFVAGAAASTVYISENIRMVIRQGPGSQHKILETLLSGDMLDMVEDGPYWSRVRLPDGRDGWAPTRFLTTQIPCSLALKLLEQKVSEMQGKTQTPAGSSEDMNTENNQLAADLTDLETRFNTLSDDYEALKKDSEEILASREKNQAMAAHLDEQSRELDLREKNLAAETFSSRLRWFLSGSGVLLAGFLLGWICKRPRSHHSLLR